MEIILNNPYRTAGLLAGVTAREQTRQIKRLRQFIEAGQEPQDDFSFPALGNFYRNIETVDQAESKLNLDIDKISAALFWFWNGNPVTDEPAFEALKSGDIEVANEIWDKLTSKIDEEGNRFWKPVTEKNHSAFHNFSVLNIFRANGDLENAIIANLCFLESDLVQKYVSSVADETYKTNKNELQLLFLNQLCLYLEANKKSTLPKFLEILNKQEFLAKQEFMKIFVQKPIEQIEQKIETAKKKRKDSKEGAAKAGQELFTTTESDLNQVKNIVGTSDIKYISISDKVANEILQCSIDYFNECQDNDSNSDYAETAMKLAKQAELIALGKLMKDRIKDNIETLEEMKDRELSNAITILKSIKSAYEDACRQIDKQVEELILKPNVSINWSKVEEMKRNSLSWDKVADVICEAIPVQNLEKIKKINNSNKVDEYKNLVNFIMSKINYFHKSRIAYINYWGTVETTNTSNSQSDFEFAPNAWWIFGLVGIFIGAMAGGGGGAFVGGLIGASFGSKFND